MTGSANYGLTIGWKSSIPRVPEELGAVFINALPKCQDKVGSKRRQTNRQPIALSGNYLDLKNPRHPVASISPPEPESTSETPASGAQTVPSCVAKTSGIDKVLQSQNTQILILLNPTSVYLFKQRNCLLKTLSTCVLWVGPVHLIICLLLGSTTFILGTFLGGTSEKIHPEHWVSLITNVLLSA